MGIEIEIEIEIEHVSGNWPGLEEVAEMTSAVAAALAGSSVIADIHAGGKAHACLALSSDSEVLQLNKQFRGQDKPTNVLSFPAHRGIAHAAARFELGDIILARETLEREACDMGIPLSNHFRHLVLHGLLHLMGYDHETDAEASEMEAIETRILADLGVPDPYAEPLAEQEM